MTIYRYEQSLGHIDSSPEPTIFLAGCTVRGHQPHLTSWRFEAIEEFERQGYKGSLIVPEFTSKTESDKGKEWVPLWEFAGLTACDCIMFWIPRTRELIGLTTNHEIAYWMVKDRDKIIYGRPDNSYRNAYLDIMWHVDATQNSKIESPIYTTLHDTVKASINKINKNQHRIKSVIPVDSPYGNF